MKEVSLRTYKNSWYKPGNKIKRVLWYALNRLFFRSSIPYPQALKKLLLVWFGAHIGQGVIFKPRVSIKYPWLLEISDFTWIGEDVWIDNLAKVTIGSNVCISQGAYLLCGNHDYKSASFDLIVKPITLENSVWIGAKATVCPGVTCGSHAVLGVGSIATSNLESFSVYMGNPAERIRERRIEA